MSDEQFQVVFVYDQPEPPDRDALLADLEYSRDDSYLLENGDLAAGLFYRPPESEDTPPAEIPDLPFAGFDVQESYIEQAGNEDNEKQLEAFLELVRDLYHAGDDRPAFGYGLQYHMGEGVWQIGTPPVDGESLADDRVNYAVWLNVFPPRLVETYGRETLLSAPVWRAEEFEDGAILLVLDDEPLYLAGFGDLNEHLGMRDPGL